jgi:carboxylesterase type B
MIVVTFNYRLNVFAFGDGQSHVNLALKDQRLLIEWAVANIEDFRGDPVSPIYAALRAIY